MACGDERGLRLSNSTTARQPDGYPSFGAEQRTRTQVNNRPYAHKVSQVPRRYSLLADTVRKASTEEFLTMPEIRERIGRNYTSVPTIINIAMNRQWLEREKDPHYQPQRYRLTQSGYAIRLAVGG